MFSKLIVAAVLGAVVGYEREVHERPAGLRTHVLVCLGSTLITLISVSFVNDPGRIAAQIVSGIGFLGAGTIMRQGNIVRGLTTAASLWTVSGIGMAVGRGGIYMWLAAFATLVVFVTLSQLRRFEPGVGKRVVYTLVLDFRSENAIALGGVIESLTAMDIILESMTSSRRKEGTCSIKVRIALPHDLGIQRVVEMLQKMDSLEHFEVGANG
ncbi:MAG TPA: MgtC/SapB family protein [Armatimonadota bacterium]|jgi:putative Mg2+ transporter-C (MgtC) family protein